MANKTISELEPRDTISANDVFAVCSEDGSQTYKVTFDQLKSTVVSSDLDERLTQVEENIKNQIQWYKGIHSCLDYGAMSEAFTDSVSCEQVPYDMRFQLINSDPIRQDKLSVVLCVDNTIIDWQLFGCDALSAKGTYDYKINPYIDIPCGSRFVAVPSNATLGKVIPQGRIIPFRYGNKTMDATSAVQYTISSLFHDTQSSDLITPLSAVGKNNSDKSQSTQTEYNLWDGSTNPWDDTGISGVIVYKWDSYPHLRKVTSAIDVTIRIEQDCNIKINRLKTSATGLQTGRDATTGEKIYYMWRNLSLTYTVGDGDSGVTYSEGDIITVKGGTTLKIHSSEWVSTYASDLPNEVSDTSAFDSKSNAKGYLLYKTPTNLLNDIVIQASPFVYY